MTIPKHFPKWDPKVDGLEDAGRWAMELERSRLPPNTVFPRAGQVWEAIRDCEVSFRASISRPFPPGAAFAASGSSMAVLNLLMGFGTAKLQRGERVRVLEGEPRPLSVHFTPLRYEELEESIVPEEVRQQPGYTGYTLHLKTVRTVSDFWLANCPSQTFFNEAFHLVKDEP
jgi:hypothetical protein